MNKNHVFDLVGKRTGLIARSAENPKYATSLDDMELLQDFLVKGAFKLASITNQISTNYVLPDEPTEEDIAVLLNGLRSELEDALVYWIMASWFSLIHKNLEIEYLQRYEAEVESYRYDPRDNFMLERPYVGI